MKAFRGRTSTCLSRRTHLNLLDIFRHHLRHILPECSQLVVANGIFGPDSGCKRDRADKHQAVSILLVKSSTEFNSSSCRLRERGELMGERTTCRAEEPSAPLTLVYESFVHIAQHSE